MKITLEGTIAEIHDYLRTYAHQLTSAPSSQQPSLAAQPEEPTLSSAPSPSSQQPCLAAQSEEPSVQQQPCLAASTEPEPSSQQPCLAAQPEEKTGIAPDSAHRPQGDAMRKNLLKGALKRITPDIAEDIRQAVNEGIAVGRIAKTFKLALASASAYIQSFGYVWDSAIRKYSSQPVPQWAMDVLMEFGPASAPAVQQQPCLAAQSEEPSSQQPCLAAKSEKVSDEVSDLDLCRNQRKFIEHSLKKNFPPKKIVAGLRKLKTDNILPDYIRMEFQKKYDHAHAIWIPVE